MKKLIVVTTLLLSLVLVYSVFAAQQTDGQMHGMMKQQTGMMNGCRMSAEKMRQMQAAMGEMKATRQQMMAAKNPAERKRLMRKHVEEMQSCMQMMPAAGQGMPCRRMQMHKGQMIDGKNCGMMAKNMGMAGHGKMMQGGCSCRQMMQEIMTGMKAQMKMMNK